MAYRIIITAGSVTVEAELNDSPTARMIWEALPITGRANTWGDEIYFEIPVEAEQAPDARADVEVGELGYWPVGRAFCIFFGPTPVSTGDQPRAASPVNIVGRVLGDAIAFQQVTAGATVTLKEAVSE
ncbi:MAG: cyclophilin-like fold protein [Anaerolineae bacterium]